MSIKIIISDTVGFKVKGSINDAAGVSQPFDFNLTAQRLDVEQIQTRIATDSDSSVTDFLASIVEGWSGVRGEDNEALAYNEANFRALCRIPGIAGLVFRTYLSEVGAKEKN